MRTHCFWLGFRWCSAFSDPLPTTACFCLCRFGCLYLLRSNCLSFTCVSPVLYLCMCILTVSKLQFRQREARLRTHCFWLGFRWCLAISDPLPTTSCFCLLRVFQRFRSCSFGSVRHGFERTVFGSDLGGLPPFSGRGSPFSGALSRIKP